MVKSWVQAPADGAGKRLETEAIATSGGTTVHREVIQIGGGGTIIANIAEVGIADPGSAATALFVRQTPTGVRQTVISGTAASFNVTVAGTKAVQSATAASFNVTVAGTKAVQSATAASFNVTALNPGLSRVQSATAASFNATVNVRANVLSNTAASFSVNIPGAKLVVSNTAASFLANVNVLGTKRVQSDTAASFLVTVAGTKAVQSATAASFNVAGVNLGLPRSTWPTASADGGAAATFSIDLERRMINAPYTPPEQSLSTTIAFSGTVPVALFGATASRRKYITSVMASNSGGTNATVDIFDRNTAGLRFLSAFVASAGGGYSYSSPVPIRGNTNSTVVVRVTPITTCLISAHGYTAP